MKNYFSDEVDQNELIEVIQSHFGRSEHLKNQLTFYNEDKSEVLVIEYNKKNKIKKIDDSNLTKLERKSLNAKVKKILIDNQVDAVGRMISFTNQAIKGSFVYKDLFQILPLPMDAPQPKNFIGDFPFLFEFKYVSSVDPFINIARQNKKAIIYLRVINALLKNSFKGPPRYTSWHWVLRFDENITTSEFLQGGYSYAIKNFNSNKYSDVSAYNEIPMLPTSEYYRNFALSVNEVTMPDTIVGLLTEVFNLKQDYEKKFYKAISWIDQADLIWSHSSSAFYICLVTTIETFLDSKSESCECCGQKKFSIKNKFMKFLEEHLQDSNEILKIKKIIYDTRSSLTHGGSVLPSDFEPWNFMTGLEAMDENQLKRTTYRLVKIAIHNWLVKINS